MPIGDDSILEVRRGRWTLGFARTRGPDGAPNGAVCRLDLDGEPKGRLSLVRSGLADDQAMEALTPKAIAWIDDYESRGHTGDTGFADL